MPRAKTNKFYRTFSKGLITEAGYLTYPEDASSDELNTILSRKGNRSRRLGLDYEPGFALNPLPASDDAVTTEFVWQSVNNDPSVSFTCLQVGNTIHFFRMNTDPLSSQRAANFTVNLWMYKIPSATDAQLASEYCDMSAGSGLLFVANRYMDPVSVEYLPDLDTLVMVPIVIQIRDFEGVYDGLANDDEPAVLSPQHHYNLLNQGWVTPGTRAVDISSPDYTGGTGEDSGDVTGGSGVPYYDPYTGEQTPAGDRGGRNFIDTQLV